MGRKTRRRSNGQQTHSQAQKNHQQQFIQEDVVLTLQQIYSINIKLFQLKSQNIPNLPYIDQLIYPEKNLNEKFIHNVKLLAQQDNCNLLYNIYYKQVKQFNQQLAQIIFKNKRNALTSFVKGYTSLQLANQEVKQLISRIFNSELLSKTCDEISKLLFYEKVYLRLNQLKLADSLDFEIQEIINELKAVNKKLKKGCAMCRKSQEKQCIISKQFNLKTKKLYTLPIDQLVSYINGSNTEEDQLNKEIRNFQTRLQEVKVQGNRLKPKINSVWLEALRFKLQGAKQSNTQMDTQLIIQLLLKPISQRGKADISRLSNQLKSIEFFQQLVQQHQDDKVVEQLSQVMLCSYYLTDEYVFHLGDPSDAFYIVLDGKVRVLVPIDQYEDEEKSQETKSSEEEEEFLITRQAGVYHRRVVNSEHPLAQLHPFANEQNIQIPQSEQLIETSVCVKGDYFGEIGLLKNLPRQASIQCVESTTLIVVQKKDYLKILKALHERQMNQKIEFLRKIPPFDQLTRNAIVKLAYLFQPQYFHHRKVVYKQGEDPKFVYITKSGQFQISQRIVQPIDNVKLGFPKRINPKRLNNIQNLNICIKVPQDMFGFDELMEEQFQQRLTNCICVSSEGELLAIKSDIFAKKVLKAYKQDIINQYKGIKDRWAQNRLKNLRKTEKLKQSILKQRLGACSVEPVKDDNVITTNVSLEKRKNKKISQYLEKMHKVSQQITQMRQKDKQVKKKLTSSMQQIGQKRAQRLFSSSQSRQNIVRSTSPIDQKSDYLTQKIEKERKPPPNFLYNMRLSYSLERHKAKGVIRRDFQRSNNRFRPSTKFKRTRHHLFR